MNNKKYLAWFVNCADNNLSAFTVGNSLLINKICESFEKLYIINIANLKFFPNKIKESNYKLDKNLKLPNNVEFFNPLDTIDFKNFMIGKELIGINRLTRGFAELKVHFLFSQHKIKEVQISNIGNTQTNLQILKGSFWKGLLAKFIHDYSHKLTVLLSNLGIVSKMEIRFTTNTNLIKYKQKGGTFLKKIFNYFNLHYAKEFILINTRSFDTIKENKIRVEESQIVLLNEMLNHPEWKKYGKSLDSKKIEKYYFYLTRVLKYLSNIYKKKVVVCVHPTVDLELTKKNFPDFEVVKYQTRENVFKAFLLLFVETSSIIDAVLLKKRILNISSNYMDKNQIITGQAYSKKLGILSINIDDDITINFNKDDFLLNLDKAKENYLDYIKSNIAPDGDNLGYEKIIRTLKERFFN